MVMVMMMMMMMMVVVVVVSARNAWHNDPPFAYKIRRKIPGGTSRKIGSGRSGPSHYFRPKSVIFPILFQI